MSRTYRRTDGASKHAISHVLTEMVTVERNGGRVFGKMTHPYTTVVSRPLVMGTLKYRRASAQYHSDVITSYRHPNRRLRNIYATRPLRRYAKKELGICVLDSTYDPVICKKYSRNYGMW